jgi:hypothetical protein
VGLYGRIALILMLSLIGLGTLAYWPDAGVCETTVWRELQAPSANKVAIVFSKDCGATTPLNTQVATVPVDSIQLRDDMEPFVVVHGRHDLEVIWLDDRTIRVMLPLGETIYRQDKVMNEVSIRYEKGSD